jgi:Eco47II restriction endonuclease
MNAKNRTSDINGDDNDGKIPTETELIAPIIIETVVRIFMVRRHLKGFSLEAYLCKIESKITSIMTQSNKKNITYDILDTSFRREKKTTYLQERQYQMKIGAIWQIVLGNYNTYIDLGIGHNTGLDIISHKLKIVMELKNRTNTDNASSKKTNFDKLSKFKKNNPHYKCIYGNINDTTEEKTITGSEKRVTHNGVEIQIYTGMKLLRFVLGDDTKIIIDHVKSIVERLS